MLKQVCTTPMCDAGQASIEEMNSVFQGLSMDLQSRFQSAHDAIMSSFNSYWITVDRWIPFNPVCCSIQQLGQQADTLTANMQIASGQSTLGSGPGTQAQPSGLLNLLGSNALWIGFAIVAGLVVLGERRL